jgi:enoyl-CoA hydratase
MACDRRVLAPGTYRIGLNEVHLGVAFPPAALEIARMRTPERAHVEVLLEGRLLEPEEALAAGLAEERASSADPVPDAIAWATRCASVPAPAWAAVKRDALAPAIARIEADRIQGRSRWLETWFSDEARARIGAVRDRLLAPRAADRDRR